jgi:hypothetical protein
VKALGALAHLTLAGLLVAPAISAFAVPPQGPVGDAYRTYVDATARTFALTGLGGAAIVALFRGYHWAVGWALVPLNASWGALGNLLGLMNHFACLLYYRDHGKPVETRSAFVRYDAGFHLKSLYDFTEGDAMSGNRVVSHEAIHVAQHFLLGPIYPLAHAAWVMLMLPAGVVAGGLFKRTIGQAITDLTYFNNPFEVLAYAGGGTRDDGEPLQPLVFNDVAAWIVSVAWIAGAIAVAYLLVVARLHRILP